MVQNPSEFYLNISAKQLVVYADNLSDITATAVARLNGPEVRVAISTGVAAYDSVMFLYSPSFRTRITVELPPQVSETSPALETLESRVQQIIRILRPGRCAVWASSSEIWKRL